jgi:hypothetical protein
LAGVAVEPDPYFSAAVSDSEVPSGDAPACAGLAARREEVRRAVAAAGEAGSESTGAGEPAPADATTTGHEG